MKSILLLVFAVLLCLCAKATNLTPPSGYEVQRLDPLGGEVLKPQGWFFNVTGTKDAAVYQIAKEDPKEGEFETGLTINIVPGISAKTGGPTTGISYFYNKKKQSAGIVSQDPVTTQGKFTRFAFAVDEERTLRGK